jgi:thiol-disulfide isomerase/thioredoxin
MPIALVIVLRYSGALAVISYATGSILLKTGLMNASTGAPAVIHEFPYDFDLRDLDGHVMNTSQLRGKTLFINIWATWCGPCRIEMPTIQALYEHSDSSKVAFLMISVDEAGHREKVRSFLTDKDFTFPVFTPVGSLPSLLQVGSIPTTFVVAPDGRVVMRESGLANYNTSEMRELLRSL